VQHFDDWLAQQEPTATDKFALGADKFRQMLQATEGVDVPLNTLEAIGQQDLERNLTALRRECEKDAPGKTLRECVQQAATQKPNSVVEAATKQLSDLKEFIVKKDVVTIPGTEELKVAEAPSYLAWNSAFIRIPGAYENNLPSIYYVAPPDPHWPPEKRTAYVQSRGSLLFISVHEGFPGHFVQFLHAKRSKSKFGQVFYSYAFSEGWAHYTEEMMYDAGLGHGDSEMHIGQRS